MKIRKMWRAGLAALVLAVAASAQQTPTPEIVVTPTPEPRPVARGTNLYCAGYIQAAPISEQFEVVGGEQEQEQRVYSQSNYIYFNAGAQQGVKVDDRFIVTRPRSGFRSPFARRKGRLGVFVEELGVVRVVNIKQQVAVAIVENSCETILLGDLLVPFVNRTAPLEREEPAFDRFRDANGKTTGRIVLARSGREMVSRDQIVYLDLGSEDGVKAGDYLSVYRPLGTGNVTRFNDTEVARPTDYGFQSERFKGGRFGNQAPRKKGARADKEIASTPDVKERRPDGLRKIVGEVVIISVQGRTATAVITRTAQEIHTGDYVELQ